MLNVCIRVFFDSYRHYTTNNFERLIEKKSLKIIYIITNSILITIGIHIRSTRFLEANVFKIMFDIDKKILEKLVIIEKICAKLIFGRCVGLNWGNYCKLKAICTANHKNNMIEAEEKNPKAKAKQFKNKKQQQKCIEKKEKICQQTIFKTQVEIKSYCFIFFSFFASCFSSVSFFISFFASCFGFFAFYSNFFSFFCSF